MIKVAASSAELIKKFTALLWPYRNRTPPKILKEGGTTRAAFAVIKNKMAAVLQRVYIRKLENTFPQRFAVTNMSAYDDEVLLSRTAGAYAFRLGTDQMIHSLSGEGAYDTLPEEPTRVSKYLAYSARYLYTLTGVGWTAEQILPAHLPSATATGTLCGTDCVGVFHNGRTLSMVASEGGENFVGALHVPSVDGLTWKEVASSQLSYQSDGNHFVAAGDPYPLMQLYPASTGFDGASSDRVAPGMFVQGQMAVVYRAGTRVYGGEIINTEETVIGAGGGTIGVPISMGAIVPKQITIDSAVAYPVYSEIFMDIYLYSAAMAAWVKIVDGVVQYFTGASIGYFSPSLFNTALYIPRIQRDPNVGAAARGLFFVRYPVTPSAVLVHAASSEENGVDAGLASVPGNYYTYGGWYSLGSTHLRVMGVGTFLVPAGSFTAALYEQTGVMWVHFSSSATAYVFNIFTGEVYYSGMSGVQFEIPAVRYLIRGHEYTVRQLCLSGTGVLSQFAVDIDGGEVMAMQVATNPVPQIMPLSDVSEVAAGEPLVVWTIGSSAGKFSLYIRTDDAWTPAAIDSLAINIGNTYIAQVAGSMLRVLSLAGAQLGEVSLTGLGVSTNPSSPPTVLFCADKTILLSKSNLNQNSLIEVYLYDVVEDTANPPAVQIVRRETDPVSHQYARLAYAHTQDYDPKLTYAGTLDSGDVRRYAGPIGASDGRALMTYTVWPMYGAGSGLEFATGDSLGQLFLLATVTPSNSDNFLGINDADNLVQAVRHTCVVPVENEADKQVGILVTELGSDTGVHTIGVAM